MKQSAALLKQGVLIFALILCAALPVFPAVDFAGKNPDEPLEITSDKMSAFQEKNLVVFSGRARVVKGDTTLKSDAIYLYYKKEPGKHPDSELIKTGSSGELDRIEAKGDVVFIQGNRTASSDEALYLRDGNKIILTGHAILKEGKNVIYGERVTIFLNEDKGIVEGGSQRQVKAIIFPKETKK